MKDDKKNSNVAKTNKLSLRKTKSLFLRFRKDGVLKIKQFVVVLAIFSLLAVSTPAAPQSLIGGVSNIHHNTMLFVKLNDWRDYIPAWFSSKEVPKQETQTKRDSRVSKIIINTGAKEFVAGRQILLSAIAYDSNDNTVSGVKFDWQVFDNEGNEQKVTDKFFKAEKAGVYTIKAKGAFNESETEIKVISPSEVKLDEDTRRINDNLTRQYDEWDVENIEEAREIINLRGNNAGKPKGRNNFNIAAPFLSMPGRGLDLNLGLYYNSQVWSKLDGDVSYDIDNDEVAPGWTVGYGKLINLIGGGIVQVDADGTRRFFSGEATVYSDRVESLEQSLDGTFVKARTVTSAIVINGTPCFYNPFAYLKYPNGKTVYYEAFEATNTGSCVDETEPITMVPRVISDSNGNQLLINYHSSNANGRFIDTITDTLGRTYVFNYELDNGKYYLESIEGPGLEPNGSGGYLPRTFVRLQYKDHTVTHNFSGLTAHVESNPVKVLEAIYYPSTQGGYWFGETDSYSPYGMIRKVEEQRGMSYDSQTGISSGTWTRRKDYAYPADTNTAIFDIPHFYEVTESWEGMTSTAPKSEFLVDWNPAIGTPRTTTVTAPNQSKTIEYSYNSSHLADTDPEKIKDGLVYKTEYYDENGQLRADSEIEWELGYQVSSKAYSKIPRPKEIKHNEYENGITRTVATKNLSFNEYNQVLVSEDIGYGGANDVLRKRIATYTKMGDTPAGDDWRARPRLINLPTSVEVQDKNGVRLSKIEYEYDINPLEALSGADPPNFCNDFFCNSITERGNLSRTKTYQDAVSLTGELVNELVYDRTGNLVENTPEISYPSKSKYKYTVATQYGYPEEVTTGSDSPSISLKTSVTYKYNSGLQDTITDPDAQIFTVERDLSNWRMTRTNLPSGGYTTFTYDDVNRVYSQFAYNSNNQVVGKQRSYTNGLGLAYRQESYVGIEQGQEVWDVTEAEYDKLLRSKRVSNSFRSNVSSSGTDWTENFYDASGRLWKTVSPNGSTKYDYFNETSRPQGASTEPGRTFRMKDPIGREKWYRTDADGNIVEVIEPDPNGNGSVATNGLVTTYEYDKLSRLVQTNQGSQTRKIRYDSLGRIMGQKMAEQKATLDNNGNFVGEGSGIWSNHYEYDKYSNVISSTDPRGVETNYSYVNPAQSQLPVDPMNRLFSISYNTNGATDVLPSPDIDFVYEASGNISRLKTVTTQGVSTTEANYDTLGRIDEQKTTLLNRPSHPMTVNYVYDSLSRITDVIYPAQHGASGNRRNIEYNYDDAGRMNNLKVTDENNNLVDYASNFVFNTFNQVTSVKIGPSGTNQITETYDYNQQTGLLENQKVLKGGTSLLDLSYEYQLCGCSGGATGQITKITNNLNRNRDREYTYDALSRLKKVTGGLNKTWSQSYTYDRYGNKTGVTSLGIEALRNSSSQIDGKEKQNEMIKKSSSIPSSLTSKDILAEVQGISKVNKIESNNSKTTKSPLDLYKESEKGDTSIDSETSSQKLKETDTEVTVKKADSYIKKEIEEPVSKELEKSEAKVESSEVKVKESEIQKLTTPSTSFDFDNDGKADYSVFQRNTNLWIINQSSNGQNLYYQFGSAGDQIAPGDYDGDGKTDVTVWRPSTGVWHTLRSSDGGYQATSFGLKGDSIMPADYDGDGKTDIAVWRPSTSIWYILRSSDGGVSATAFGGQQFGDIPASDDFDGDGKTDIAVWRPSNGVWYIIQSSNSQVLSISFGLSGDVPVSADYDGDGKADVAVWRPSTGYWYITQSSNGQVTSTPFGGLTFGDIPVSADYDGDGKTDIAVWRPSNGVWYIIQSSNGAVISYQYGSSMDIPVPSAYRRRSSSPKNQNKEVPRDGLESVSYDATSNRITTTGFEYDLAGNQTRKIDGNGTALRFQYDAAGRLAKVKDDNNQTIETYTYGASRERLITQHGNESSTDFTYYAWEGGAVISEYSDLNGNALVWTKNYIYMSGKLLALQEQTTNGEKVQFEHPDQLGTRMITDPGTGTVYEQNTLPFGTALESETSGAIPNRRFTNYDRSTSTGLDYATNRFYDSSQGRFTQVDPITMASTSLTNPQSLNLFAYTENDPVNKTDPNGLDGTPNSYLGYYYWWMWGGFGGAGGSSTNTALTRFLQGLFGSFSADYAGRIIPVGDFTTFTRTFESAMITHGLDNAGETKKTNTTRKDSKLSGCLKDLLTGFFPDYNINSSYGDVLNASFRDGLPGGNIGKAVFTVLDYVPGVVYPGAITLGAVIYKGSLINSISTPNWSEFETIIEELVHVEQFFSYWASVQLKNKRKFSYRTARDGWFNKYLLGGTDYDTNKYEVAAKKRASDIVSQISGRTEFAKSYLDYLNGKGGKGPCSK